MSNAVSYHGTTAKLQEFAEFANGPFDRAEWFALLSDHGIKPCIAVAEQYQSRCAMVLHRTDNGLESLTNWFSFSWKTLGDSERCLELVARSIKSRTSCIVMSPVSAANSDPIAIAFRRAGWFVKQEVCGENFYLKLNGQSFGEYWSNRPGHLRTTVKRKAAHIDTEVYSTFDEAAWEKYRSVYQASWKPREERADILEAFARSEAKSGHIRLGVAKTDGVPVAAQFWTVEGGTAYIHKLAHSKEFDRLSAGTVLTATMFEHVIDIDKVQMIDFGTGSDPYKRDWMHTSRPLYRVTCLDWRQPRAWPSIVKAVVRLLARCQRQG